MRPAATALVRGNPNAQQQPGTAAQANPGAKTGGTGLVGSLSNDPGPAMADNTPLVNTINSQGYLANTLGQERRQAGMNPMAAPSTAYTPLYTGNIDPVRQQQQQALSQLQAAANGQAPSAAELQAQQQASRAASQQFGQAAALQGGLSPGAALAMASNGAAQTQADVANQNAVLRANEMANARQQLVQGLSGVRGQEQDLAGQNAGLQQQSALANLNSQLTTTGQNQDWQKALLSGQLQSSQNQGTTAGALASANANAAASANAYNSSYIQQGKQALKSVTPYLKKIPLVGGLF